MVVVVATVVVVVVGGGALRSAASAAAGVWQSVPLVTAAARAASYWLSATSSGSHVVTRQHELHDVGEHRRRGRAAELGRRLVEHDDRREPRVLGRRSR